MYVHLPLLILIVSLVYSATRHDDWKKIIREALGWGFRMTSFLVTIGVILYLLSSYP